MISKFKLCIQLNTISIIIFSILYYIISCINHLSHKYIDCLWFSILSQSTVGYGYDIINKLKEKSDIFKYLNILQLLTIIVINGYLLD